MYAAVTLISEFKTDDPTFAILNTITLGLYWKTISDAYNVALACDPTSAFGGVLIANTKSMLQQVK
jgi:phosphoribosylaminoimidazolecarboxamide formyltransferase/IMP cyclohydrolase